MRIGILSTVGGYSWAGTEEVWYQFAKLAIQEGHQVCLGASKSIARSTQVEELKSLGLQACDRSPFRPTRLYLAKERIRPDMQPLIEFAPDVLIVNSGSPLDVTNQPHLEQFIQRFSCKKVFFCHFNSDRLIFNNRDQLRSFLSGFDHHVFVSESNKTLLETQIAYQFTKSTTILNSSRLELEKPIPFPTTDRARFVNLARFETAWKGQDILFEIFKSAHWANRECELLLYGSGPDQGYLESLINFFNVSEKIKIAGYVRDINKVFEKASLLVLPSRGEGTPLALIEAMMCGRPAVVTDVGGNREIIEDGVSGFIADAPTHFSFSKALERAWGARENWESMGHHAHKKAKKLARSNPPEQLLSVLKRLASDK